MLEWVRYRPTREWSTGWSICWSRSGIDLPVSGIMGGVYAGVGINLPVSGVQSGVYAGGSGIDLPVSGIQGGVYAGVGQV